MIDSDMDEDSKIKAKSNYALVLWKKGELDSAINLLEEVLSEYTSTVVYGSLGYLYILKGDLEKAVEFNKEAYDYNDSDPIILDNLGNAYYLTGELSKSKEIYKELMNLNPQFPEAFYNYSLLLKKLGKLDEALDYMKKLIILICLFEQFNKNRHRKAVKGNRGYYNKTALNTRKTLKLAIF